MDITGVFGTRSLKATFTWSTGAFYTKESNKEVRGKEYKSVDIYFDASRDWTGATNSNG